MPEQLEMLQSRVKKLSALRDQLIRDEGAAARKLEEAQEKLRALGIETAGLDSKALQVQAEALEAELEAKVAELTAEVEKGEQLVAKYNQVRAI
jgi:hypothetical protein